MTAGWLRAGSCAFALLACSVLPLAARAERDACVASHADAQVLRLSGELLAARAMLLACAQDECPKLVVNDCTLWLSEVDASLSSVVFAVDGSDGRDLVEVRVFANERLLAERADGRALPLDPGPYEFRFEAKGHADRTLSVSIRQSEKNRIVRVRLEPLASGPADSPTQQHMTAPRATTSTVPLATYVLGGVALAATGTFVYFAVSGKQEYNELRDTCGGHCSATQVEDGKRAYLIADVALGIAIASAAAATVVYFTSRGRPDPIDGSGRRARLQAAVFEHGAYLGYSARY